MTSIDGCLEGKKNKCSRVFLSTASSKLSLDKSRKIQFLILPQFSEKTAFSINERNCQVIFLQNLRVA